MSKRSRRRAKVQRQREGGCPTCGHLVHVRPRRGRVRVTLSQPLAWHGRARRTPNMPSVRLGRWERHQPAKGDRWWFGHCPDPWHQRNLLGNLDRHGEPKRRR